MGAPCDYNPNDGFANRGFANYLAFRNHDPSRLDIKPMLEERNVLVDGAVVKMPDPTKIDDIFAFKNGFFGWTGQIDLPGLQPFQLFLFLNWMSGASKVLSSDVILY